MSNFDDIFSGQGEKPRWNDQPFDKEAWATKKQEERKELYALADSTATKVSKDGDKFRQYLDVQSRFSRYTPTNALLILAQMPEATQLKDFDGWKEAGVSVQRKPRSVKILEPGKEYDRENGTRGTSFEVKRVYDVSQTRGRVRSAPAVKLDDRVLLKALIHRTPVSIQTVDSLPNNLGAIKILCVLGIIPVVWLALLIAPFVSGGLAEIVAQFPAAMENPFHIALCEDSRKTVLIFLLIYALSIGVALSSRRNYRRGEEHGSAKWGSATAVNKKYQAKDPEANKVFTKHVRMGLDGRKHRRNLNTVVVGGSGSGKSRFYALINLLQACSSYFVLDCKGELLRMTGTFLKMRGYEIKVLDLLSMEKSHCFNPFAYLQTDNDVQKLVTSLFKATTPKGSQSNDPFWDTAASMLLSAIIFYLLYKAPEEEQNFPMVMEMLRAGEVREDDDTYQSPLDELFERLEMRNPDHIAVKYYKDYHSGSAKTLKSIQITLAARLEKFNLASVAALTATDELELASLGEKKVALFALIPDHDVSFNFLVSMVYSCTFEQLFRLADDKYKGALPVPVHFLMDEFANVSLPDDFDKLLATMRSRNVFVSIIIQNIAQLKNLFEKQWESILGNCDEFLYLGGNETGTHKMIAESYLGKQTIDLNTYGKSSGRSGNYSTNWQITGRELLDAAEVRMLDNRYALLFIRGELPVMDEKYNLLNHPNVKFTPEKGGAPYVHGGTELSVGSLTLTAVTGKEKNYVNLSETEFELLSDEEIEEELLNGGKQNEEHH